MNGWRGWGGEEGPDPAKVSFAIGAALGLVVLGWMLLARPGEENVSSSGFSDGGAGMSTSLFARRSAPQTGLAPAESGVASAAAAPSTAAIAAAPLVPPAAAAQDANRLGGVPSSSGTSSSAH
jgi:hypothetical protein